MAHQSTDLTTNLVNIGQSNLSGDKRALYLKLFSGEMFKGFQHNAIARDLVMKRTLKNGKSLQFIYTGRTTAEYHTPGNAILGNSDGAPPVAEKTVTVDDLLLVQRSYTTLTRHFLTTIFARRSHVRSAMLLQKSMTA